MAARLPAITMPATWRGPLPALLFGLGLDAAAARARLQGHDLAGRAVRLTPRGGRWALLVLCVLGCEADRELLQELRGRHARAPHFDLVLVATDGLRDEVAEVAAALDRVAPAAPGASLLWRHAPGHSDGFGQPARLPALFLIDGQGRIVERHADRLPAAAWQRLHGRRGG